MQWLIVTELKPAGHRLPRVGYGRIPGKERIAFSMLPEEELAAAIERYTQDWPYEFRLLDDQSQVHYIGRCHDLFDARTMHPCAPLYWARFDAGCTVMQYRKLGRRTWSTF